MSGKRASLSVHNKDTLPPQQILDLFKTCFAEELYHDVGGSLEDTIQEVKSDLYNREYIRAFDSEKKRIAYCCRWSPSRAVAYASLLSYLEPVRNILQCKSSINKSDDRESNRTADACSNGVTTTELDGLRNLSITNSASKVLCIGGGAGGELAALASIFTPCRDFNSKFSTSKKNTDAGDLEVHVVDIADWGSVLTRLEQEISNTWLYGEAVHFTVRFTNRNVLTLTASEMELQNLDLITLLFTTNELFLENRASSIRFLQKLNQECSPGAHLLIVESAGSYSHIQIGAKKFPIQFLIDTILLGKRGEESQGSWELISQNDSLWYRGDERSFDYPLKVENMRFFYRLYKKREVQL